MWVKSKLSAHFYYANFYLAEVTSTPANLEASVTVTQNQSLPETDKSDKELEQEEEAVEDVKPHLTPGSKAEYSGDKATRAPLASFSQVNRSLTTTTTPRAATPASKVEVEVVKLPKKSDEAIEDSLENAESESN